MSQAQHYTASPPTTVKTADSSTHLAPEGTDDTAIGSAPSAATRSVASFRDLLQGKHAQPLTNTEHQTLYSFLMQANNEAPRDEVLGSFLLTFPDHVRSTDEICELLIRQAISLQSTLPDDYTGSALGALLRKKSHSLRNTFRLQREPHMSVSVDAINDVRAKKHIDGVMYVDVVVLCQPRQYRGSLEC